MRPLQLAPSKQDLAPPRDEGAPPPITEVGKNTASDLVALVTAEVKLARLELLTGARHVLSRATWTLIAIVPMLVAYVAGVAALAAWLVGRWGWPAGLGATAASQA